MSIKAFTRKKMSAGRKFFIFCCIIIPSVHFLVFYVYLNFSAFLMGFQRNIDGQTVWSLENFKLVFKALGSKENELGLAFINTFKTFAISLAMFPFGVAVSYFIFKKIWLYKTFRILFFLPSIISSLVVAFVFTSFVSPRGFVAPLVQSLFGLEYIPSLLADSTFANPTVWFHMMWLGFPGSMLLWGGTFSRIPVSTLEYAKIDGVGWLRELFQIIVPIVWSTFSMLLVLQFAGAFSASGAVFLLTNGGQYDTQTLSNWFFMQVYSVSQTGNFRSNVFNYMSAFGLFVTILACTVAFSARAILKRIKQDVEF